MRRVQFTLGAPNPALIYEGAPPEIRPLIEQNRMTEGYCVMFIDDEGGDAIVALSACLCAFQSLTEAWLMGCSPEELQALLVKQAGERHGEQGHREQS